nr:MAG TPA: hypothetical protein [Caudoviricetes sp.]
MCQKLKPCQQYKYTRRYSRFLFRLTGNLKPFFFKENNSLH